MARASGGVVFLTSTAASPTSYATGSAGVALLPKATAWTTVSDRNAKKNFQPVDTVAVLDKLAAIPIQQWNYKWEKDTDVPNIGPMAQDFKPAFYPGRDDKGISTLEFDGVELAAIQGLNQKLERANGGQGRRNSASLKARLERLEQLMAEKLGRREMKARRLKMEDGGWNTRSVLECGDMSPLWNTATCRRVGKRGLVRALPKLLACFIILHSAFCLRKVLTISVDWYKIAGGGGTSTGGTYQVSGTIGQPDASGAMTGGNYSLTGHRAAWHPAGRSCH